MYHSINIGDKNTFDDWHLIYPGRPFVNPPQPKFNYVDILGKHGSLDYTEALVKTPRYSDREGTWEFIILNPGDVDGLLGQDDNVILNSNELCSQIMSYCNGKRFEKIWLEDDPDYFYSGRVWVSGVQTGSSWSRIILGYHLDPFKHKTTDSSIQTITINKTEIYPSDAVLVPFNIIAGAPPSQLYLRFSTTSEDYAAISFRFRNPEISPSEYWYSASTELDLTPSTFDKVLEFPTFLLSNMSGDNVPDILFGPNPDIDPSFYDPGPVKIEYWWREAAL